MSDYILHMDDGSVITHFGIPHQKHGVRHGPPYPLDKKISARIRSGKKVRAKSVSEKISSSFKKLSSGKSSSDKPKKRKLSELTDDELRARINRINLERQYKDLVTPKKTNDKSKSKLFKTVGKDIYQKFLLPAGQDVAKNLIAPFLVHELGSMINKKLGIDVIDTSYSTKKSKDHPSNQSDEKQDDSSGGQSSNPFENIFNQKASGQPKSKKRRKNKRSRSNSSDAVIDLDDDWELIIPSRD